MDELDKKAYEGAMKNFYDKKASVVQGQNNAIQQISEDEKPKAFNSGLPTGKIEQVEFERRMTQNVDPDLTVGVEIVKLPSKGLFYANGISEVLVEYMTSKDEDILSTYSLIENGTVFDILLKSKVKSSGVNVEDLLVGDKNAILLFLRASSYGKDYEVKVKDPRNGLAFNHQVDLTKLKHKQIIEMPDAKMEYSVELPIRKKIIKFKMLNSREIEAVIKNAQNRKDAFGTPYSELNTLKLKAEIVEINGNRDKTYISRFVDAMPVQDSMTVKKKILEVTPDIDTVYTFKTTDGYEFEGFVGIGIDFFFPSN